MAKLLYEIYTISIKGKTRREKIQLLNNESSSYALLKENHISLANVDGISYPDIIIDSLNSSSFVYITGINKEQSYLLIYVENDIIYSGLLKHSEIKSKLLLYKSRFKKNQVSFYGFKVDSSLLFDQEIHEIGYDFSQEVDQSHYQLQVVGRVKNQLQKPLILSIKLLASGLLVIGGCWAYNTYKFYQKNEEQVKVAQQEIDLWKSYRSSVKGSDIPIELNELFEKLDKTQVLFDVPIKQFNYQNKQLDIVFATFNHPVIDLQDWAKANNYQVSKLTSAEVGMTQSLDVPIDVKDNTIMNADRLTAWLIDYFNAQNQFVNLSFGQVENYSNYKIVQCRLSIENMPETLIQSLFEKMNQLPIRLSSVNGYLALGSFTGEINLRIIGGLS